MRCSSLSHPGRLHLILSKPLSGLACQGFSFAKKAFKKAAFGLRRPFFLEKVADKIIDLLDSKSPALRSSVGLDAHFFGLLRRWLPRGIYHRLLYALLPGIHRWGTGIRDEEKGDSFANKSRKYSDK